MSEILNRFSLNAAKFNVEVWLSLMLIWLLVLACTIASIRVQRFSVRQRRFWILAVCVAPIFGTLAYLPFSCRWEQLAQLFFIRSDRNRRKVGATDGGPSNGRQSP